MAQTQKMAVVFEVKMLSKEKSGNEKAVIALLDEAKEQAKKKEYAEKYRNESEEVRMVGIVFDEETRKVAKWCEV